MPRNDFDFVFIFFELFDNFVVSAVSKIPVKFALPLLLMLTPERN
jgi:hypothetical protein